MPFCANILQQLRPLFIVPCVGSSWPTSIGKAVCIWWIHVLAVLMLLNPFNEVRKCGTYFHCANYCCSLEKSLPDGGAGGSNHSICSVISSYHLSRAASQSIIQKTSRKHPMQWISFAFMSKQSVTSLWHDSSNVLPWSFVLILITWSLDSVYWSGIPSFTFHPKTNEPIRAR